MALIQMLLQQCTVFGVSLPAPDIRSQWHHYAARAGSTGSNTTDWPITKQGDLRGYETMIIVGITSLVALLLFDLLLLVIGV